MGGCASVPSSGAGSYGRDGRVPLAREDRVLIGRFTDVVGVAVGRRYVYTPTTGGIAVWDRQFSDWLPPLVLPPSELPTRAVVMAADPLTDGVWIGGFGEILYWRPELDALTRTLVTGEVDGILFDKRDLTGGALVHAAGQWLRVSEGGFSTPVAPGQLPPAGMRESASSLAAIYQEFPTLRTFGGQLTRDDVTLRSWPVSAGGRAPDRTEVWLGTWGDGVFQVDPSFNSSTHHPFGLLTTDVGAIALAADGIWAAGGGDAGAQRAGLVFASSSLRDWRWLEHPLRSPLLGARAYDLALRGSRAWAATDRGVARLDTRTPSDLRVWNATNGLPSDVALSVAVRDDGAWVGTSRGLVFVTDSVARRTAQARAGDVSPVLAADVPVRALLFTGDTLWIGTDAGLLLLPPGSDPETARPLRPSMLAAEPRLSQRIMALAASDSLVVVATQTELLRFDLRTGRLLPRFQTVDPARTGGITALAVDERTIWAVGPDGVLVVSRSSELTRFVNGSLDLGGSPTDVVLAGDWAWVSTRAGLVRLRRRADGTPP